MASHHGCVLSNRTTLVALAALTLLPVACGDDGGGKAAAAPTTTALPQGNVKVDLDPASFTAEVDNPWFPLPPGTRWTYREVDADGTVFDVQVIATSRTHRVANGIEARVVRDTVRQDGQVKEDTFDWYAQDHDGNVWYMGEQTTEYPPGEPQSTEGSWEAGVDGAQPGVAVPAAPRAGLAYRQEYLKGQAEDQAVVLSTDEKVQTPTGTYTGALLTRETTALEPDVAELKFYVPKVGQVLTLQTSGGSEREALTEVSG